MTQKFKGTELKQSKVVKNILKVYNDTTFTAESNWYTTANELAVSLAKAYDYNLLQVAGVIAALSPLKSWDENKRIAEAFLKSGDAYHTGTMIAKADDIVNYDGNFQREFILTTLNGNKIQNFFLNIAYPMAKEGVTIDRHAVSIAFGKSLPDSMLRSITDRQYEFFAECYRIAAAKAGILPNEMQAVTWVKWRKLKDAKKFEDVPF